MPQIDSRFAIYAHDLQNLGLANFIIVRLKKHYLGRQLIYSFKKPYILLRNHRLFIDKSDTVVSEMLINEGIWEPFVTQVFEKTLRPGNIVVDIGANIGYYTLLSSLKVGSTGKVYAFEPSPQSYSFLKKTIDTNHLSNIIALKQAVGIKTAAGKIYYNPKNFGDNRTYDSGDSRPTTDIAIISLDDYFLKSKEVINLLKIDIQGYEMNALLGMKKLLAKKRIINIISELWPSGLAQAGSSWKQYISFLQQNGFNIFQIDESTTKLVPFSFTKISSAFANDPTYTTNILCRLPNP